MRITTALHAIAWMLLGVMAVSSVAMAHGAGKEFSETKNGYTVDIAASAFEFRTDENVRFDLALTGATSSEAASFANVWVQIRKGSTVHYAGTLDRLLNDSALLVYRFPESGDFELTARYQRGGEELVEATFPIEVKGGAGSDSGFWGQGATSLALAALVGLAVGLGGTLVLFQVARSQTER